jgi:hypothetical protein
MASALSRRVEKVVGYPPLCEMSDQQRLASRRGHVRGSVREVAGGNPPGRAEPTDAARRQRT